MGSTKVEAPSTPQPQTTAQSMADYVQSLPALYQAQMQYEPLMQQQNLQMLQQYGGQYGAAMKNINDMLYPETAQLQEQLASQASAGMEAGVPEAQKRMYQDQIRANLGTNAGSGIGADYTSRQMVNQQQQYQDYYRNLGLSVAGRQPLSSGGTQAQTNYMQGYQPAQALNYNANTYGSYSGAYANMYGANAGLRANVNSINQGYAQMGMQGVGAMMSSIRYKKNVRLWE